MNEKKNTARRDSRPVSARDAAYRSLCACERDKKYSNLEIDAAIRRYRLEGADKGLYTTLVYGVIERRITLDYIIGRLSAKPIEALDGEVITLLRLGLYQLIYLDRIPDSAAVNETVDLAKKYTRAHAFVNAVLRSFLREMGKDRIPYPDKSDRNRYLSVRYSIAPEVVKLLADSVSDAEALLEAFEARHEVTLRVNTLKTSRDELLAKLREAHGDAVEATKYSPFGIKLKNGVIFREITELIDAGYVYIQYEASQLALLAVNPKPCSTLIDTCACPGGKSFSAAILMENNGSVQSFDLHKSKLSLIAQGAGKLGIDIIKTAEKNGSVSDAALVSSADTVLCDVPCSGLGVIAKKPEIRYKSAADIERLPEIQYAILSTAADYVKPGGVLCYSTCTLNRAENEAVVTRFLEADSRFAPCEFEAGGLSSKDGMLTLLPHVHGTDGFFIAKFQKKQV